MNPALEEVDTLYRQIQDYIDPSREVLNSWSEKDWAKVQENRTQTSQIYNLALEKIGVIQPNLSRAEIIEGYANGCNLLQRNLSGYMAQNFHHEYIPTMTDAIRKPHLHTAWLFLQALADQLGQEVAPLAIEMLETEGVRETALNVVDQLHIVEALTKVKELMQDKDSKIAFLADQVREKLENDG